MHKGKLGRYYGGALNMSKKQGNSMAHALAKKTHVNRLRDLDGNQARLHYT